MAFVMQWFWYLLAFVLGSAVAWGATLVLVKSTGEEEAP
jgi:uncharacterized membrane protein ArfB